MLDTVIIGGGLCGLALARNLHRQGRSVALFEARQRLGGRILSASGAGMVMDLGPTWFWPATQPLMTGLIDELKLASLEQYDDGAMLHLRDPDKKPERVEGKRVHEGARRLAGGMAAMIDALAAELPASLIHFEHILTRLRDRDDHVALEFVAGDDIVEYATRHVALAVPPRLLEQNVRFEPDLEEPVREAMRGAETWMASQAKVMVGYDRPCWRDAGQSGSAFVTHEQAVIGEIFDACNDAGSQAALGGFVALSPELRVSFSIGLPILIANQMEQVFGPALGEGEQHVQDWATEPFTCSALDITSFSVEHADMANPMLRRAQWGGKLHMGGSETAAHGAGYMEGALDAALRIERELNRSLAAMSAVQAAAGHPAPTVDAVLSLNATSLARFAAWVAGQGDVVFDGYRQRLNRSLAMQQTDQLTQRAILEAIEDAFDRALDALEELDFDMSAATVERGRSSLMPELQAPFREFLKSALDDVIAFNRTSCALSNFPDEHRLSKDYERVILRDIAAAWQEFLLSANRLLLAKAGAPSRAARGRGLTNLRP